MKVLNCCQYGHRLCILSCVLLPNWSESSSLNLLVLLLFDHLYPAKNWHLSSFLYLSQNLIKLFSPFHWSCVKHCILFAHRIFFIFIVTVELHHCSTQMRVCWICSHVGIQGNVHADSAAKEICSHLPSGIAFANLIKTACWCVTGIVDNYFCCIEGTCWDSSGRRNLM